MQKCKIENDEFSKRKIKYLMHSLPDKAFEDTIVNPNVLLCGIQIKGQRISRLCPDKVNWQSLRL